MVHIINELLHSFARRMDRLGTSPLHDRTFVHKKESKCNMLHNMGILNRHAVRVCDDGGKDKVRLRAKLKHED